MSGSDFSVLAFGKNDNGQLLWDKFFTRKFSTTNLAQSINTNNKRNNITTITIPLTITITKQQQ